MESIDVFAPLASLQWVDRNTRRRSGGQRLRDGHGAAGGGRAAHRLGPA